MCSDAADDVYLRRSQPGGLDHLSLGLAVAYARDAMGRTHGVTARARGSNPCRSVVSSIGYQPFGPVNALTYGNGIAGDAQLRPRLSLDQSRGQRRSRSLPMATMPRTMCCRSPTGSRPATARASAMTRSNRLTSATGSYGISATPMTPTATGSAESLGGSATIPSPLDNLGSETSLTYNQAGRPATVPQEPIAHALHIRRLRAAPRKSRVGHRDIALPVRRNRSSAGGEQRASAQADYVYLDDGRPVATIEPGSAKLFFLHDDRLGTPQAGDRRQQGRATGPTNYQPFGLTSSFPALIGQDLRLPGQELDLETGFYHNGFRDYAPGWGRYDESDPVGLAGGTNMYQYAEGNPIKWVDPSGRDPWVGPAIGFVVGGSAGYAAGGWTGAAIGAPIGLLVGVVSPTLSEGAAAYVVGLTGSGTAGVVAGPVVTSATASLGAGAATVGYNSWTGQPWNQDLGASMLLAAGTPLLSLEAPIAALGWADASALAFISANTGVLDVASSFTYSRWRAKQNTLNQFCTLK